MTVEINISRRLKYHLVHKRRKSFSSTLLKKSKVSSTNFQGKLQFVNSVKRLAFDLTKILFLNRLIGIARLTAEVLNDENLFTESNLTNWFSGYVQFCSGCHFSERAEAAWWSRKMNHLNPISTGGGGGGRGAFHPGFCFSCTFSFLSQFLPNLVTFLKFNVE